MISTIDKVFEQEIEKITESAVDMEALTSYTLADAIRGGASVTGKTEGGWGRAGEACALTAAAIHIKAMQQK